MPTAKMGAVQQSTAREAGDKEEEEEEGGGGGTQATLTRGGAHTGCPELPQDEALLALRQRQEELVGFHALLTERKHTASSLWRTAPLQGSSAPSRPTSASLAREARTHPPVFLDKCPRTQGLTLLGCLFLLL